MPERLAGLLRIVRTLLGYGRHLADTVEQRAPSPSFTSVAAYFGTGNLSMIVARLHRGILRACVLERVLLARAATGRDVAFVAARPHTDEGLPAPAGAPGEQDAPAAADAPVAAGATAAAPPVRDPTAAKPSRGRGVRFTGADDPAEFYMPSMAELEVQVRRRPLGRTIVDICLDLAAFPGLCTGPFWNELFDAIRLYGGSLATVVGERMAREQAFDREQDRRPTRGWDWRDATKERVRQALGFLIGETPAFPLALSPGPAAPAAIATGPP